MNIKDLKYNAEEQKEFIKKGGLIKAAKDESAILKKAWDKKEKEKSAKK